MRNVAVEVSKRGRLLQAARELGPKATATQIAQYSGLKNRKSVNRYFGKINSLKECAGFKIKNPRERLIEAAKLAGSRASSREITKLACYKSSKIINLKFGSLCALKLTAGTYTSNKNDIIWPDVEFSPKDESIGVRIPNEIDESVAEETGIHVGDGCLPNMTNPYDYRIEVGGHKVDEKRYYDETVARLFRKVFNYDVKPVEVSTKYAIIVNSKAIFTFKRNVIKLPVGNKNNIQIPEIILRSSEEVQKAFIRGLVDTDFSLVFSKKHKNKHYYPIIVAEFSSRHLVEQLGTLLRGFGFIVKTTFNNERPNPRDKTKILTHHIIKMFGEYNLEKWVSEIDFHSPKHFTKYQVWKEFGFCPPRLTTPEREAVLRGEREICET